MNQIQKPVILVAGAAGLQGGAAVTALLAKGSFAISAIVRDKGSEAALALAAKNVELVETTFDDLAGLTKAAQGATGVFSVQMGTHPGNKGGGNAPCHQSGGGRQGGERAAVRAYLRGAGRGAGKLRGLG